MSEQQRRPQPDRVLALRIALLMKFGTMAAAGLLSFGVVLLAFRVELATPVLAAGCALLVLLPLVRLVLMATHFARFHDGVFALTALLVLALVIAGAAVGLAR